MEDLNQLKNLLEASFKGRTTEEVKNAEKGLSQASKHPEYLKFLSHLLRDNSLEMQTRTAASTQFQSYVRAYVTSQKKQKAKSAVSIFEQIVAAIRDEQIHVTLKQHLAKALTIILCIDQDNQMKLQIFQLTKEWMLTDNHVLLSGTFILMHTAITSTQNKEFLSIFFTDLSLPFCQVGTKYLSSVTGALVNLQTPTETESASQVIFNEIVEALKVLNLWAMVLKDLVTLIVESKTTMLIKVILSNDILANLICHGICVTLNTEKQISDCLICTSGKKDFDQQANKLKSTLIKTYTTVNRHMFYERSRYQISESQFYQMLSKIIPIVLKALIVFCQQSPAFQTDLEEPSLASVVIECLKFATVCAEQTEFYSIFQDCSVVLLLEVVFPLLRTSRAEEDTLRNDPEEFVRLSLDTCDRQVNIFISFQLADHTASLATLLLLVFQILIDQCIDCVWYFVQISYSYKCASAKLLETVCDYIDGFETIVSLLLLSVIGFSIKYESLDEIDNNYPNLINFKQTVFFARTPRHTRIETSLVSLSILSYLTPKRPDIVVQIEKIIRDHSDFLFNPQLTLIIKSRVCLLLGYYTDAIFQNEPETFQKLFQFLLNCLTLKEEEEQGVALQAIDSLLEIYEDEGQVNIVADYAEDVLKVMLQLITTTEFNKLLDIILQIFKHHGNKISVQTSMTTIHYFVKRIVDEVQLLQENLRKDQLFINKSWNVIRQMSENKTIVPQHIDGFLEQAKPLLLCLQHPDNIDFDEDVILLVSSFVKHSNNVHPIIAETLTLFPLVLTKQQNVLGQMFSAFNNMIIYGKDFFISNLDHLKLIIEMAYKALFSDSEKSQDSDRAEGATIMQLIIQTMGPQLPDEIWKVMISAAATRFQTMNLKHQFVYGRIAGIFLSSFLADEQRSQVIMQELGILETVVDISTNNLAFYKRPYDMKLFIMSISHVIVRLNLDAQKLLKIFDTLLTVMIKQKDMETAAQKKKANDVDLDDDDFGSDDSDDLGDGDDLDEEEEDDIDGDNYNYTDSSVSSDKLTMKYFENPIVKKDEFAFFKTSFDLMKTQNWQLLQQLITNLPAEKQEYLKQLLSIKRIEIGGDQSVIRVIRKIKRTIPQAGTKMI